MFEKEKTINGILHYRNSPTEDFKPYSLKQLSEMIRNLENENTELFIDLEKIKNENRR